MFMHPSGANSTTGRVKIDSVTGNSEPNISESSVNHEVSEQNLAVSCLNA